MNSAEQYKNALSIINNFSKLGKIIWSKHILIRMQQRDIKVKDVINCLETGKIIEFYSEDFPFPSYLILGKSYSNEPMHVVCSLGEDKIWMITAYYPSSDEWEDDFRTRRK